MAWASSCSWRIYKYFTAASTIAHFSMTTANHIWHNATAACSQSQVFKLNCLQFRHVIHWKHLIYNDRGGNNTVKKSLFFSTNGVLSQTFSDILVEEKYFRINFYSISCGWIVLHMCTLNVNMLWSHSVRVKSHAFWYGLFMLNVNTIWQLECGICGNY